MVSKPKPKARPALSPKGMRLQEDASREAMTPFGGPTPGGKVKPVTSLNLGIGKQKKSKRND